MECGGSLLRKGIYFSFLFETVLQGCVNILSLASVGELLR